MRYFLGVGKYTPNAAVIGEMAWRPSSVRQWSCISNFWCRLGNMDVSRLNKRIALWANRLAGTACKNWFYSVKHKLSSLGLTDHIDIALPIPKLSFKKSVEESMLNLFQIDWLHSIQNVSSTNGRGRNKLRTYRLFKNTFTVEPYCTMILSFCHRSAFSKFRCGVAPIRLETGRYENLPISERKCPFCNSVEDECHVIVDCNLYNDIRVKMLAKAIAICDTFENLPNTDKLVILFTHPALIRLCAKTCFDILKRR